MGKKMKMRIDNLIRKVGALTLVLAFAVQTFAATVTFREGVNLTGSATVYTGTSDTYLQQNPGSQNANNGAAADWGWDGDDPSGTGYDIYGLIRFDGIFGNATGQIPPGQEITEATLYLTVFDTGDVGSVREALMPWTESSTFASFCGASCDDGIEWGPQVATANAASTTEIAINVTASVAAWQAGGTNNGWIIVPTGNGGVDVRSSEYGTVAQRPRLVVRYGEGGPTVGTLIRQPYLQLGTPTSMTICWRSDTPTNSRVNYGTVQGSLTSAADDLTVTSDHSVTITNLAPNTKYFYSVGSTTGVQGGGTAEHYFVTSPVSGSSQSFRIWVVGDGGNGSSTQVSVMNAMLTAAGVNRPNFAVHVGDISYTSGTDEEFTTNHFAPYSPVLRNTVLWPTLGNHEGASTTSGGCWPLPCSPGTTAGPYYTAMVLPANGEAGGVPSGTEAYYSFDYANVHFICLNSYEVSRSSSGPMAQWLQADLAATTQEWVVAFWHHPPYSKGTHNSDTETELREMRQNLVPILEAGGVDLVLCGHSHAYERSYLIDGFYSTPTTVPGDGEILDNGDGRISGDGAYQKPPGISAREGAVYVVAGHGGQSTGGSLNHPVMYHSESSFGSCLVDVNGSELTLRNVRIDGQITDNFTIIKGDLPPRVSSESPQKEAVISALQSISVTFDRAVTGVDAGDLTVNGSPASSLTVNSPSQYVFSGFAIPGNGAVAVVIAPGGILDADNPTLAFNGATWGYTIDNQPPVIASRTPAAGATVAVMPSVTVHFSKPVTGVTADDLRVNGSPATSLVGAQNTAGPFIFSGYAVPAAGPVSVELVADSIVDDISQQFAGENWSYTLKLSLIINEFLASNNTINADPNGEFDDWIEIYNPGATIVDMSGMYLTDNLGFPSQYKIPDGVTIGPGAYLIFWCDSTPSQGPLHTNFNISRTGEELGLFDTSDNGFAFIDGFSFGEQTTDVSSGRYPNGFGNIVVLASPSPGASNGGEPTTIDPLPILVGESWKYFKGTAEPSPGNLSAWRQIAFDDSSWSVGPTGIGYADCSPATVLSDMINTYSSVFLRKAFTVTNPQQVTSLTLTMDYDDGFVAYLNGVEVARQHVVGSPPAFNTLATPPGGNHECGTPEVFDLSAFISALVPGTNVLAIQGHNATLASSDFVLIPTLTSTETQCSSPSECDDGNPCTIDSCNAGVCVNTPVTCPPGQACNPSNGQCETAPQTATFRDGLNGYSSTADTFIRQTNVNQNNGSTQDLRWDTEESGANTPQYTLIRFDNIFGGGAGQIPPGATVTNATLTYTVGGDTNAPGNPAGLHECLVSWDESTVTYANFGGDSGVQSDEYAALSVATLTAPSAASFTVNVTSSLAAWSANPSANLGWIAIPSGTDGVQVRSSDYTATASQRPTLEVTYFISVSCDDDLDCDDGNPCTIDDCDNGTCVNTPIPGCCNVAVDCDDGDPCTIDSCDNGACVNTPVVCPPGESCNNTNGNCEPPPPATLTFQQGVNGYAGAVDTYVEPANPSTDRSGATPLIVDLSPLTQTLLRFDNIFGNAPGQIPPGSTIVSATLTINVTNTTAPGALLHRMIQSWPASSTWNSLGAGVQANDVEAVSVPDVTLVNVPLGSQSFSVTNSLQAWSSAPATNQGWAWLPPVQDDSLQFSSSEAGTASERPRLSVTFIIPNDCIEDSECDDGDPCTTDDCVGTACVNTPIPGCCDEVADCDDGNACTIDTCEAGVCVHTPVSCGPGLICNAQNGQCEPPAPVVVTFQQGVGGYTGSKDTFLNANAVTTSNATVTPLIIDGGPPATDERHTLLRFDNIFGNGVGQVPPGATIESATLTINVTNESTTGASLHRMIAPWEDTATWSSMGGGIQADGIEAETLADVSGLSDLGTYVLDVTASVEAWASGATNRGWAFLPGGTNSWQFSSAEATTSSQRPLLTIIYSETPTAICGNGVLEAGEECDDGVGNSDTDPDACRTDCTSPECGDGVVDSGEICDDGNFVSQDGCESDCTLSPTLTIHLSIDGLIGDGSGTPYGATTAHPDGSLLDRSIEIVLSRCSSPADVRNVMVTFSASGPNGVGTAVLTGFGIDETIAWVSAREGHTLRTLRPVTWINGEAVVEMPLRSGDFQTAGAPQDGIVDIVDFSILSARWNQSIDASSALGADATGDGQQATADFQAIQVNFFATSDAPDGCGNGIIDDSPLPGAPIERPSNRPIKGEITLNTDVMNVSSELGAKSARRSISVVELSGRVSNASKADLDGDGLVDIKDVRAFAKRHRLPLSKKFVEKLEGMTNVSDGTLRP